MSQSIAFYGIRFPSYVRRRLISAHSQWGKLDCPGSLRKKKMYCCVNAAVVMRGLADLSAYRLSARAGCFFSFFFFFPVFRGRGGSGAGPASAYLSVSFEMKAKR